MAPLTLSQSRFHALVAFVLCICLQLSSVHCQATTTSSAVQTETSSTATIYPGTASWGYYGCYNETVLLNSTGNARALSGDIQAKDTMTVQTCVDFCTGKGFSLAGLEYTRECYCANNINALSTKLDDSECNLPCMGNSTQICGGALSLTVYSKKTSTKDAGSPIAREAPVGSILALGIAMGTLFCLA